MIAAITTIPQLLLEKQVYLEHYTAARRMSCASKRTTTRIEDEAYSLLGLFDVSMPLLYGEGRDAFTRLQEEILGHSLDLSILAWDINGEEKVDAVPHRLFAVSTSCFVNSRYVNCTPHRTARSVSLLNEGLSVSAQVGTIKFGYGRVICSIELGCYNERYPFSSLAVITDTASGISADVQPVRVNALAYHRLAVTQPTQTLQRRNVLLLRDERRSVKTDDRRVQITMRKRYHRPSRKSEEWWLAKIVEAVPPERWNTHSLMCNIPPRTTASAVTQDAEPFRLGFVLEIVKRRRYSADIETTERTR